MSKEDEEDFVQDFLSAGSHETRFEDYLSLFLRGKWIIMLTVVLSLIVSIVYTSRLKPVYESTAVVLINTKVGKQALGFTGLVDGGSSKIPNELGILKTKMLAEMVGRALLQAPYRDSVAKVMYPIVRNDPGNEANKRLASLAAVAARARRSVEFTPERESDIIRITARSEDPYEAATLANTYADTYQDHITEASRVRSKSIREFLESRLKEQSDSLQKAEVTLKGFMESSGIVSLDAESNRIVQGLSQMQANRDALDVDIQTRSRQLASLQEQLPIQASNAANVIGQANDPYIRLLQEQLARLEVQRDVITVQNDPKVLGQELYSQKLKDIETQITALRDKLKAKSNELIASILPGEQLVGQADAIGLIKTLKQRMLETKLELEAMQTKRKALDRIIEEFDAKFQKIPRESMQFARLQRERLSTEKLYLMVGERYNEAQITEKSEFGYVDVIDRAAVPGGPVSPNLQTNLMISALLGLGLGSLIVVLKEMLDVRARTPEQLKRKGYVCLSEIAPMQQELKELVKSDMIPPEALKFNKQLWLIFHPLSLLAESYRRLRTNILHLHVEKPIRTILISSANPSEGKTTTACNLAVAFAESQRRVLLIDADLRRPTIHTAFNLPPKPGLTDILMDKLPAEKAIRRDVVENLDVIFCGSMLRAPARIFGSRAMRAFIDEIQKNYALVIIDAPPVLVVNDAAVLANAVDGTILTVFSGGTRLASLEKAREYFRRGGGRMLGIVLNRFDARRAYGGYYGSYRYGHYGSKDGYYSSASGNNGHAKNNIFRVAKLFSRPKDS